MSNDFIFQCTLPDQTAILSKHQMNECFNLVTTTSCCRRMSCMHFRRIHKIDVVFFIGSCFSNYYFHVCFKIPGLPAKKSLNVYDHEATLHVHLCKSQRPMPSFSFLTKNIQNEDLCTLIKRQTTTFQIQKALPKKKRPNHNQNSRIFGFSI